MSHAKRPIWRPEDISREDVTHAQEYLEGVIQSTLGNNAAALENAQTSLKLILMAASAWVHHAQALRDAQAEISQRNIKPRFFQGSETKDRKKSGTASREDVEAGGQARDSEGGD